METNPILLIKNKILTNGNFIPIISKKKKKICTDQLPSIRVYLPYIWSNLLKSELNVKNI